MLIMKLQVLLVGAVCATGAVGWVGYICDCEVGECYLVESCW